MPKVALSDKDLSLKMFMAFYVIGILILFPAFMTMVLNSLPKSSKTFFIILVVAMKDIDNFIYTTLPLPVPRTKESMPEKCTPLLIRNPLVLSFSNKEINSALFSHLQIKNFLNKSDMVKYTSPFSITCAVHNNGTVATIFRCNTFQRITIRQIKLYSHPD